MNHEDNVYQIINGTNNGTLNAAKGNITSVNKINMDTCSDTLEKIRELLGKIDMDAEQKESAQDDLEIIQEEVKNSNPRLVRVKKAFSGLSRIILNLPTQLKFVNEILPQIDELGRHITDLVK